ncbi:putative quinol monooxygenase [Aeromicrobium duanguangcaii]|uniref:Antibiotic biosynthesis monooxygenase n=1 Tax=Aeromicrobium duanguangcaii TaxID=2968086 RepID=A0ABY5KFB9_9ACTN|nr:putative quinol monooxygenase [Aeromicrobium duanguangcaii]MCD9153901.1 antibiotic biosynthesis monooxygenase [Aeromicrobium duanguangcaii]UUI69020.1 antibiotic biosynthesis monooxygenase [Aeromicrobium duanguangcaii]
MINVTAAVTVREGRAADFEAAVADARPGMLADPGCTRWDLQRVSRSEVDYVLLEEYVDGDALRRHGQSAEFVAFGEVLKDMIAGPPVLSVLKPVGEQSR